MKLYRFSILRKKHLQKGNGHAIISLKGFVWATELAGTGGGGVQGGHHTRKVLRCKKKENPSMHPFLICYTCNVGHVLASRQSPIFHTGSDACIWRKQLLWPASKAGTLAWLGRRYVRKRNPKLTLQLVAHFQLLL